jgi:hypothetical protein
MNLQIVLVVVVVPERGIQIGAEDYDEDEKRPTGLSSQGAI